MSVFLDSSFLEVIVISKRINKFIIVFMVIAITCIFTFTVSAAGGSDVVVFYDLIAYGGPSGYERVECDIVYQTVGDDLLVTLKPKNQLEFLIMIDRGYEFDLSLDFSSQSYDNIIFNNTMPIQFTSSNQSLVTSFVYALEDNPMFGGVSAMFNFNALDNMSEFSFALSDKTSFDFFAPPEPPGFMVFLSDVVILFDNSLEWFSLLFSNVSKYAPLLILVCGFAIVGFSFSLLRRVQR